MNQQGTLAKVLMYYGLIDNVVSPRQKIVCPFHEDINPSMIVDLEDNGWFCFGCQLSGDASQFVNYANPKLNDLDSYIAYLRLLKSDKVEHLELKYRKSKKQKKRQSIIEYEMACHYYYGLGTVDWFSTDNPEVVEIVDYLEQRGFTKQVLNDVGAKVTYNNHYGTIFPLMDNDIFRGWVSRTTIPEIEKKRKYLYNKGFSRATTLVGQYGKKDYVYVVEGYMDMLRLWQHGVRNIVAVLGWKASYDQIQKLKDAGITEIISVLDNDKYGKKGTKHLKKYFDVVVPWSYLKGVKDPGEMTKQDFKKMHQRTIERFKKYKTEKRSRK